MSNTESTKHPGNNTVPCKFFMRGKCREGESCQYSHDPDLIRRHTLAEQKTAAISSQESSRVKGTIKAHNSAITQMTTMSGDYLLLSVSDDRNVNIWNRDLCNQHLLQADAVVTTVAQTTDIIFLGEFVKDAPNSPAVIAIVVVNIAANSISYIQEGLTSAVVFMGYDSSQNLLFSVQRNGTLTVYNAQNGFKLIYSTSLGIDVLCACMSDNVIFAGSKGGNIAIFDIASKQIYPISSEIPLRNLFVIHDNDAIKLLAVRSEGTLSLYSIPELREIQTGSIGSKVITSAVYKDILNNWMLISSCQKSPTQIALSVLYINGFHRKGLMQNATSAPVTSLACIDKNGDEGDFIVAGCQDGSVTLLDMSV